MKENPRCRDNEKHPSKLRRRRISACRLPWVSNLDPKACKEGTGESVEIGWDGMESEEWDGMRWDGMGCDGMGQEGMGWDGWDGMEWDGLGWDG